MSNASRPLNAHGASPPDLAWGESGLSGLIAEARAGRESTRQILQHIKGAIRIGPPAADSSAADGGSLVHVLAAYERHLVKPKAP